VRRAGDVHRGELEVTTEGWSFTTEDTKRTEVGFSLVSRCSAALQCDSVTEKKKILRALRALRGERLRPSVVNVFARFAVTRLSL
jgi:hypothetical protein